MSIQIGDNNNIKNSSIGHQYGSNRGEKESKEKKPFFEKHPALFSFIISLLAGFILLFSFWKSVIIWIESLFK